MKVLILILSFFLSVFNGGRMTNIGQYVEQTSIVAETAGHDKTGQTANYCHQAILPAQSVRFAGQENCVTSTVRSNDSGRRTQVFHKFPFRIIKAGKIVDRHHFLNYRAELHRFQTGIRSTSRYIHSICHLLI